MSILSYLIKRSKIPTKVKLLYYLLLNPFDNKTLDVYKSLITLKKNHNKRHLDWELIFPQNIENERQLELCEVLFRRICAKYTTLVCLCKITLNSRYFNILKVLFFYIWWRYLSAFLSLSHCLYLATTHHERNIKQKTILKSHLNTIKY